MVEIVGYAHDWAEVRDEEENFELALKNDSHHGCEEHSKEIEKIKESSLVELKKEYDLMKL